MYDVMDFTRVRALACYVWYIVLIIVTFEAAIGDGKMKAMSFMECNKNEYNVYDQNGYTLEWSGDVNSTRTFDCEFRGYKESDDDTNYLVCIVATTWDMDYDIKMEYYTYSPTKNNRFGDGWFISSPQKSFYQRPYFKDASDPTESWCEGKKGESDDIVGVQLTVRPDSSERKIVINITGKVDPNYIDLKNFRLILGLSIGLSALVTAIICAVVITVVYKRNKTERHRNYADEYTSAYEHQNRGSRTIEMQDSSNTSTANQTRGSESNLFTPSAPLVDPIINRSDVDAPPPVYDDVVSDENPLKYIQETDPNHIPGPPPPSYQSVSEGQGDLSITT